MEAKQFLLLFLLLPISVTIKAQHTISGTVSDAKTGETLPSTNILIEGTYKGTITNTDGNYSLSIPDSLLPATVIVRYLGYQSVRRKITSQSKKQQDFTLKPAITNMQEIVVTDEDPGIRIMREVIKRKKQWRRKLNTYEADAYTRQKISNDTSIVSITESVSEVFWDKEQGHREVLKSKRQTANIEAADNFAGVSYLPNFYDDNIKISGFKLVGVTHPDALNYYNFELIDQTSLDNQTVFEIKVTPKRKLQPLFKGMVYVIDKEYALAEVDLTPNDVVSFPFPVKSFNLAYEQQFNNFGKDFWLPVDVRIGGKIKISMVGLDFPLIQFNQLSRITNYKVNTSLPDSLYKKEDLFSVDSTTVSSDSLIYKQVDTVPLSAEEEEAYVTVDSTATLEEAFKPTGFLAQFMEEDENSNTGPFSFLGEVPGNISPDARYNRVDELFAGLKYNIKLTDRLRLDAKGGYSTGYKKWSYGGGLNLNWLQKEKVSAFVGAHYNAETTPRNKSRIYSPFYSSIPNLMGYKGYFDYFRSEGFRIFSSLKLPKDNLSITAGFNSKKHHSLITTTAYDITGRSDNYRANPPINEGRIQSIDITAGYNLDNAYNFGTTAQNFILFQIEHASDSFGSDFNFSRYNTQMGWSFPTFYQRRFMPNTLDINIQAGTYSGNLPTQKLGAIDVALSNTSPFGVMRASRGRPFEGKQYLALNIEHNFRTIPFEALGLRPLVERNIGLIAFGGVARTWPEWNSLKSPLAGFQPQGTEGTYWEAGASINGLFGVFRVDFAARLDEPAFLVNIGVARIF
ncbi:DUF5686 and carboxypeptidase-like regulatory domain-containing protein [Fodinibius saliphilus]|uniref:DUF5686 and carboxypeptidase-like regulatory domain-containing protein n=1 Tax=Fodinibius saliphilus TaxID=1920650 RepID=UPI001486EDC7|nr:DUF5686 and carboxypeptidase-like regulatory domain-containing protein [Fodinibius saliphilus]